MKNINLLKGQFGLEREALRINHSGEIAKTKHPEVFKETNPFITKDFSESQIEMVTPPCDSIDSAVNFLEDIQTIVLENIDGEFLWKQSNPPIIKDLEDIEIASFENKADFEYRKYLSIKYAKEKSLLSGVHFNFSFDDELIKQFHQKENPSSDFIYFKNEFYLKIVKHLMLNRWYFIYLSAASPVFHNSYFKKCVDKSIQTEKGDCTILNLQSLRNSACGYRNLDTFFLDYRSLEAYHKNIEKLQYTNKIASYSELYSPIKLKFDALNNVEYIELRFLDSNPFTESGVSSTDLKYIHLFIIYAAYQNDFDFTAKMQTEADKRQEKIAVYDGLDKSVNSEMLLIHDALTEFFKEYQLPETYEKSLLEMSSRINNPEHTYVHKLNQSYQSEGYINFHLRTAKEDKAHNFKNRFLLKTYPNLELSTKILIKEAIKQGYLVSILDEKTHFISLQDPQTGKVELIQQATKTNLDRYANILAMENKLISKKLLRQQAIQTPTGIALNAIEELDLYDWDKYQKEGLVIKPNNTNFGEGISIFTNSVNRKELEKAVECALDKDDTVLIESYIEGEEYRFLVIDDQVNAVLKRVPANVMGDGKSTIAELVSIKNKHPYRSQRYITPLEKIDLGEREIAYLTMQGLSPESIPDDKQRIFLRNNSNISTGGDSIDYTDKIDPSYKKIAEKASRVLDVKITGVDMIIKDIKTEANSDNYSILELNYNPAIHIHTFPLEGINRNPAAAIIKALFKKEPKHDVK